jgi:hypothetical protein
VDVSAAPSLPFSSETIVFKLELGDYNVLEEKLEALIVVVCRNMRVIS